MMYCDLSSRCADGDLQDAAAVGPLSAVLPEVKVAPAVAVNIPVSTPHVLGPGAGPGLDLMALTRFDDCA